MIHASFFQNIEQVKEALKAQLAIRDNHLQHDLKTLKTNLALNAAISRFQGFEEGIKYAICAIEDYQNTPRPLEDTSKMPQKEN